MAPEVAGGHLRAGEQVMTGGVGGRYSVGSRDQELGCRGWGGCS